MFRYDKKRINKEVDELKKLLAITKGAKASNKSVSATFLREAVDITGIPTTTPTPEEGNQEPLPQDSAEMTKTDDTKEIQKAILNSTITSIGPEGDEQVVKGYVSTAGEEKGLYFKFSTKENSPMIQTKKAVVLDDNLAKSIEQISTYFDTWKTNAEK